MCYNGVEKEMTLMGSRNIEVYSGLGRLPRASAPDMLVPGCIVLEGGAFRGLYTTGVLDAMMEEGLNLRCTIGVSAGAVNGMNYVSGQIGRSALANLGYRHDPRYVGSTAVKDNKGVIGFNFLFKDFEKIYPFDRKRYMDPRRRFIIVVTDCETGEAVYCEKGRTGSTKRAIRASASMPYVSKPVRVDGRPSLDGGCAVKIPFQWAIDEGYEKIVLVRTREKTYRRKENSPETRLAHKFYRKYPLLADQLATSPARSNADLDEIERLEDAGRMFVIAPSEPVEVDRLESDMEKLGALYRLGYDDAKARMPELKAYLGVE